MRFSFLSYAVLAKFSTAVERKGEARPRLAQPKETLSKPAFYTACKFASQDCWLRSSVVHFGEGREREVLFFRPSKGGHIATRKRRRRGGEISRSRDALAARVGVGSAAAESHPWNLARSVFLV